MVPEQARRYEDETFYFERLGSYSELHIAAEVLTGPHPTTELYEGAAIVITTEDADGNLRGRNATNYNTRVLFGGDRITRIQIGTGVKLQDDSYTLVGEATTTYTIQPGDTLMVTRETTQDEETILVPAGEHLPPSKEWTRYTPRGIIKEDGTFVLWGPEGRYSHGTIDMAIASHHAATNVDNYHLDQKVLSGHLVGMVHGDVTATAFLNYFRDRFGVDFMPTKTPADRWAEFGYMTRELASRYQ